MTMRPDRKCCGFGCSCVTLSEEEPSVDVISWEPNEAGIRSALEAHLADQKVSLYGRAFGILTESERRECVDFLASVVLDVMERTTSTIHD